ncbi:hypothetical protein BGZ80_002866 [Entomortierella chlamydospora]|uniref:Uncharacterized protein n=1 Tax=Entomortierella chlamydospora TaxID=101097 RepID=A0A9P6MQ75_9FUNG|nr:hypothetical protein BGZ79_006836 [Entomortierella chlamydospora]KAG0008967.1 hypothetical protein BGZ80_002866 [Entomortierella chlamydospora]
MSFPKWVYVKTKVPYMGANRDRVLPRPLKEQEVFVVVKFQIPQKLSIGGFRIFTLQRQTVDRRLKKLIADNNKLGSVELKMLRFDPSLRGENAIQHMRRDKDAPIEFNNRSFVLRGNSNIEMIEYITKVFNAYTDDYSEGAVSSESD